jgi:hypothetical protein
MIGIPIDMYPTFPTDADMVLLTECAKFTGVTIAGEPVPMQPKGQMPLRAKRTSFTLTMMPHSFVALAEE